MPHEVGATPGIAQVVMASSKCSAALAEESDRPIECNLRLMKLHHHAVATVEQRSVGLEKVEFAPLDIELQQIDPGFVAESCVELAEHIDDRDAYLPHAE